MRQECKKFKFYGHCATVWKCVPWIHSQTCQWHQRSRLECTLFSHPRRCQTWGSFLLGECMCL